MSQFSDVVDVLCDEEDGYDCSLETAQEAVGQFQKKKDMKIDEIPESEFDADEIAEAVYSDSECWD